MASMSGTRRRTTSASASRSPASRPAVEFGKSVTASSYSREVYSCPTPSSRSPVLHPQAGNPLEFSYVVRDERCTRGEGVGADQGIEGPDRSSELLEVAADLSVDTGRAFVEGKDPKEVSDPLDRPSRPHGMLALLGAEHQLGDRDGRDGYLFWRAPFEVRRDVRRPALQDVNDGAGIEKTEHQSRGGTSAETSPIVSGKSSGK